MHEAGSGVRAYKSCPEWLPAAELVAAYSPTRAGDSMARAVPSNAELDRLAGELEQYRE
jgi:hypothetical protein